MPRENSGPMQTGLLRALISCGDRQVKKLFGLAQG
jgi:hypothetical protein